MRIKNEYPEKIYWRAFKPQDMLHVVGLHQGSVPPGQIGEWREDTFDGIKVEVKTGDIVFSKKWLFHAGQIFHMKDDLILDKDGRLSVAEVSFTPPKPENITFKDVQFVDARNFNTAFTRKVTFFLQNSLSTRQELQEASEHERTWTVGAKIAGTLKKKDVGSASAEISSQFQDKATEKLAKDYEQQVTSVWSKCVEDNFTFEPGKLYVIAVNWTIQMQTGLASYFGEQADFSALSSASGNLTTLGAFDSEEQLDPYLQKRYEELGKRDQVPA